MRAVGNTSPALYGTYQAAELQDGMDEFESQCILYSDLIHCRNIESFKSWTMTLTNAAPIQKITIVMLKESQLMDSNACPSSQTLWFHIMVHHALCALPERKLRLTNPHIMLCIFRLLYQLGEM